MGETRQEAAHTPTPWFLGASSGNYVGRAVCGKSGTIASLSGGYQGKVDADAEFIVQACNQHAELSAKAKLLDEAVAALLAFEEAWEQRPPGGTTECGYWVDVLTKARAVLAKVTDA